MPALPQVRRVFVVDDEPLIASTLATILCHHGFDATSFSKPLEALLASRSEAPDLLISDVMMPTLSGIELAIQVQEAWPKCKVLLFSGQALTDDSLESARRAGHHFEVLTKPIHPAELLRKIQSLADEAPPRPSVTGVPRRKFYLRSA
jgi:DNA-binding response OmpR family regulator